MTSVPPRGVDVAQLPTAAHRLQRDVLVVSTVALSFISFWRAAAIVLCDLASTAYYIGGISEQAIGKAAPWFILGVMLFSYAVRNVYVEACTMFTRGGVYKVVREAMGGGLAKLSVSALMFDYILTGPISGVSAGQYMVGLYIDMLNLVNRHIHHPLIDPAFHKGSIDSATVLLALGITVYFWRSNIIGIHESSDKALRIMQLTTVMGILILAWSGLTLGLRHNTLHMPPTHPVFTQSSVDSTKESSSGWLQNFPRILGALGILVAFGHTLLAMSGEESLAQVYREIAAPKLRNLLRCGLVIFLYSLLLTSLISFLAVLIIPDGKRVKTQIIDNGKSPDTAILVDYIRHDSATGRDWGYRITNDERDFPVVDRHQVITIDWKTQHLERGDGGYRDNLINGLVQYLAGPRWIKIILECFVVTVGFLILAGAVNTSIVGSNGVLNRLAEDGVLTSWFLHPQKKFGTTHRLINLVAILQVVTILASWGDVNTLGEAYAFGVIWSFVFMTFAMVVLRFKDKSPRAYEVPLNIRHKTRSGAEIDWPIGILIVFLILLSTALMNLLTKKTATIWGVSFTLGLLTIFVIVERINTRRRGRHAEYIAQFNERGSDRLDVASLGLEHPNPIVVAARGPRSLPVLQKILHEVDTTRRDVVVLTCKVLPARTAGVTQQDVAIDEGDRDLLTKIVKVAEEIGKHVYPVVLPTNNPLYAIAAAARDLKATEVVLGVSEKIQAEEQLEQFAMAWGSATAESMPQHSPVVRVVGPQVEIKYSLA
jgi:amino acid transporter